MGFRGISFSLFFCVFALSSVVSAQHESWHLQKVTDGIHIYSRTNPDSEILELKMTSEINGASLASFAALFNDVNSYQNWVYSCAEAKVLNRISEAEILYYMKSSFPWPLSDRDFVIRNKVWQNQKTHAFHSKSVAYNNFKTVSEGVVRITEFEAEWIITPLKEGSFELVYTFLMNPGGNVPAWLVNMFVDYGPLKTIKAMETHAQHESYATANFSYLKERP